MALKYWNERHAIAENPYESSWEGDSYARKLELEFIETCLGRMHRPSVLELGCGGFTLDEFESRIPQRIGPYVGIDGSPVAIEQAKERFKAGLFLCRDLNEPLTLRPTAELVICRRLIQNLEPDNRGWIFPFLAKHKAGIVLECSLAAMEKTNKIRATYRHQPLTESPFNKYLTASETGRLEANPAVETHYPLGYYYYETLGCLNCRDSYEAYAQSKKSVGFQFGPLQAWTWGLDG